MLKRQTKSDSGHMNTPVSEAAPLVWLKCCYHLHTFAYRDPRSAFSSAVGLPVVSPTAVLLGIASTLFNLGMGDEAQSFLKIANQCGVMIDPPSGAIFFRAFHQLRRYYSTTKGRTSRVGFTNVNQGTREYAIIDGLITLYVGVPEKYVSSVEIALVNRDHLGTHDSLCSLVGNIEKCERPESVIFSPVRKFKLNDSAPVTTLTLSCFKQQSEPTVGKHWWMSGGDDTELVPYVIQGSFRGTTRGKIYRKKF
jgi:hypothetical protein